MNYQSYTQMQSSQYVSVFPENNVKLKNVQRLETKTSVFIITHDINPSPRMK